MMKLLEPGQLPTVDELAEIIAARDPGLADWLRRAEAPQVRLIGWAASREATGWASSASDEIVAVAATWSTPSRIGRTLHGEATIVQVVTGGLTGGEGWAGYRQYLVRRALSDEQAAWVAALAVADAMPVLARRGEL